MKYTNLNVLNNNATASYPNTLFVHNILNMGSKKITFLNFLNSRTIPEQD